MMLGVRSGGVDVGVRIGGGLGGIHSDGVRGV